MLAMSDNATAASFTLIGPKHTTHNKQNLGFCVRVSVVMDAIQRPSECRLGLGVAVTTQANQLCIQSHNGSNHLSSTVRVAGAVSTTDRRSSMLSELRRL